MFTVPTEKENNL